mmetsp:Transcript_11803/g.31648  ORF Transcript_11803/g.31648 Transcript_11803/m.31648 type:complete len:116 (+) Transcript_11803:90-437(+)
MRYAIGSREHRRARAIPKSFGFDHPWLPLCSTTAAIHCAEAFRHAGTNKRTSEHIPEAVLLMATRADSTNTLYISQQARRSHLEWQKGVTTKHTFGRVRLRNLFGMEILPQKVFH